jgi:hypothetical protein
MNPPGRALKLLVQIGFAFKHQLDDDLDDSEQQSIGQTVKNAAEQAEEKTPAIRPDKAPELAQKGNHSLLGMMLAASGADGENFVCPARPGCGSLNH